MKYSLMLPALTAVLFSCQPDADEILPPQPDMANDSIYLKRTFTLDTTQVSGKDTAAKEEFFYDAQKRISLLRFYEYKPGVGQAEYWYEFQWHYQGNDTLPHMLVAHWTNQAPPQTTFQLDTAFLLYDNNRKVILDSTVSHGVGSQFFRTQTNRFTSLSTNKFLLTRINRVYQYGFPAITSDTFRYVSQKTWANGNMTARRDSSYFNGLVTETQQSYDNHPNPYKRIFVADGQNIFNLDFILYGGNENNVTRYYSQSQQAGSVTDFSINYSYRADGYPVVIRQPGSPVKMTIQYTKL